MGVGGSCRGQQEGARELGRELAGRGAVTPACSSQDTGALCQARPALTGTGAEVKHVSEGPEGSREQRMCREKPLGEGGRSSVSPFWREGPSQAPPRLPAPQAREQGSGSGEAPGLSGGPRRPGGAGPPHLSTATSAQAASPAVPLHEECSRSSMAVVCTACGFKHHRNDSPAWLMLPGHRPSSVSQTNLVAAGAGSEAGQRPSAGRAHGGFRAGVGAGQAVTCNPDPTKLRADTASAHHPAVLGWHHSRAWASRPKRVQQPVTTPPVPHAVDPGALSRSSPRAPLWGTVGLGPTEKGEGG